jgi:predicted RNase H-like HicB family nuclease
MKILIIVEQSETGFSAYSPDLPGCVSTGATRDECTENMREAIEFHLEGMKEEGLPLPNPTSSSTYI